MASEREEAERIVRVLNAAEEALAALDQLAGSETAVERVAKRCYDSIERSRENTAEWWNEDHVCRVARCNKADEGYHTSADGKCDVWLLVQDATKDGDGRIWCGGCATTAAEKYEESKERA